MNTNHTAIVTGASRGLGHELARALADAGWSLVLDARGAAALADAAEDIRRARGATTSTTIVAIAGDVADPAHRKALVQAAGATGGLDLLVNNASILGPSPQPALSSYPLAALRDVYEINVVAPLALIQAALPLLRVAGLGRVLNVTSDASVEPYAGWGGYGSSKAALDHLNAILAAEEPSVRFWAVDPGDMRTQLHQAAFPGEDISDRPEPAAIVPAILQLIRSDRPSGRIAISGLSVPVGAA